MVDFNINILNYDSDKDTSDFLDTMYASSSYPTINTPTQELHQPQKLLLIINFIMILQKIIQQGTF